MTVSTAASRVEYNTNGTTGPWTVPFPFIRSDYLSVTHVASDGTQTLLVLNVGYTVDTTLLRVNTTTAYPAGGQIVIQRTIEATQELDLRNADSFPPESVETALDKLTMLALEAKDDSARSLRVPEVSGALPILPAKEARANRVLAFGSDGMPLATLPTPGDATAVYIDLANSADVTKGDALIAVKRTEAGFAGTTLDLWLKRRALRLKDFGCVLDGVTDDTAAFNLALTAIAAQGGGELQFGMGTLRLASAITDIPENLTLRGDSWEVSQIKVDGAFVGLTKTYATHTDVNRLNFACLHVGFIGTASSLGAVELIRPDYADFEHCGFTGLGSANAFGLKWTNAYRSSVRHCHFEEIKKYGIQFELDGAVGCNAITIGPRNEFIGNNQTAFSAMLLRGQQIEVIGNDMSGVSDGLHAIILENCEGVHISHNYIERWAGQAIKCNSGGASRRITVDRNVLNSTGVPCLDFDHASTNVRVTVTRNRFPDMGGGQTCIKQGATTGFVEYGNDPDASSATSTFIPSADPAGSQTGSFTGTITGCTTSPTGTVRFELIGNTVRLELPAILGTSNSTGLTMTGIPDRLKPARNQVDQCGYRDNGTDNRGIAIVDTGGVLTVQNNAGSSAFFTASGQKGIGGGAFVYALR